MSSHCCARGDCVVNIAERSISRGRYSGHDDGGGGTGKKNARGGKVVGVAKQIAAGMATGGNSDAINTASSGCGISQQEQNAKAVLLPASSGGQELVYEADRCSASCYTCLRVLRFPVFSTVVSLHH